MFSWVCVHMFVCLQSKRYPKIKIQHPQIQNNKQEDTQWVSKRERNGKGICVCDSWRRSGSWVCSSWIHKEGSLSRWTLHNLWRTSKLFLSLSLLFISCLWKFHWVHVFNVMNPLVSKKKEWELTSHPSRRRVEREIWERKWEICCLISSVLKCYGWQVFVQVSCKSY